MFKKIIQVVLEWLVRRYLKRHKPTLVVITGSVGKTSTKLAIANVLAQSLRVRTHEGNHNTHLSAPLAIMGIDFPDNIHSIGAWWLVLKAALARISGPKDADVIVQELGTDHPGDIAHFGKYLKPDIAVVTAVSPEHMEFFNEIDNVASEELKVTEFSAYSVINRDDVDGKYADLAHTGSLTTYGLSAAAEYLFVPKNFTVKDGYSGTMSTPELGEFKVAVNVVSEQTVKSAIAAVAVAARLGLGRDQIIKGLSLIRPVPGRMNVLRGAHDSIILDDTYNASPLAVEAALKTLYGLPTGQRIAILGSMNELGATAQAEHEKIGRLCDPSLLAWVLTIGEDAAKWIAPMAREKGCQVKSFKSPYAAGAFAHKVIERGGVILAKGSQNGVFAEEAVKMLLYSTEDEVQLVRQSDAWMKKKREQFL